jgi:ADP-heptose:LPS heptosyltransferase
MVSEWNQAPSANSPSVLLVRLDALGDALTLIPLIASLRRRAFRIGAVLCPANSQIFSARALDRIHVAGDAPSREVANDIASEGYGTALIATEKPEGYRMAYQARIPRRIGFENGWGKPLKTLWIRRLCTRTVFRTAGLDPRAPHECDVVFSLARTILDGTEAPRDARVLRPYVIDDEPAADERIAFQVTDKWQRLGGSLDDVVALAQRLAARRHLRFIAAQHEGTYASEFARASGFTVERFATLAPWKNGIAAARALVAPDSGAVHVAGMVGTPVVSCFARNAFALQAKRWAPWAAPHRIVCLADAWPLVAADALEDLLSGSPQFSYTG